jgi:hypothetical protein
MEHGPEVALKWRYTSPRETAMVLAILISVVVGFAGLMAYMFYLTPGPNDRL